MTRGHNSTLNSDLGSYFYVKSRPRVTIQRGIMNRGHISTWNLDPGHNSTWNYDPDPISTWNSDPGSHFNVEFWPRVNIPRWIMTQVRIPHWIVIPIPGHNLTLNNDSGWKFNVELVLRVIIQRGIKTCGHISKGGGVQILSVGGVVIQWTPVSGIAIQHEKAVESWAQLIESRPPGLKFNRVIIQSYNGTDVQADWRRSCTYGRAPNAIDIS